jgi:tetratricopeptide (TPR) repeat protein
VLTGPSAIKINPQYTQALYRRAYIYMIMGQYDPAIADLNQTIQLDPKFTQAYLRRINAYVLKGDYGQAIAALDQTIQTDPKNFGAYNHLAWLLATCPQAGFRDGKKAVGNATMACELTGWKGSAMLDTLAASYAEAGDFASAVKWENQAISVQRSPDTADAQKGRLALYQSGHPYHVEKYDIKFEAAVN